jgi:hypothetical protein
VHVPEVPVSICVGQFTVTDAVAPTNDGPVGVMPPFARSPPQPATRPRAAAAIHRLKCSIGSTPSKWGSFETRAWRIGYSERNPHSVISQYLSLKDCVYTADDEVLGLA